MGVCLGTTLDDHCCAVRLLFTKTGDARNLELRDDYWRMMEEIEPVLKALEVATTALCAEEAVSLSDVYPVVCGLMKEHLLATNQSDGRIRSFVNTVRESLAKRFLPFDINGFNVCSGCCSLRPPA